jgi:glycosyltransferase involved in cell wall biosynthesis
MKVMSAPARRILMIAPQPFFRPRGTPFSVLHRLRALARLGHTVDLITYPFGDSPALNGVTIHRAARPPGIHDVPVGPSIRKVFLDIPLFRLATRLLAHRHYDLIHTHEEAGIMGAWLMRRSGVPHLYDMHSSLPQQFENFDRFNVPAVVALFHRLERYTLANSAGVIAICPALLDRVTELGYSGPLALIENTLDVDPPALTESDDAELRAHLRIDGRRVVVYTGTFEPYQGLDLLARAAHHVLRHAGDACFVTVGGNEDQHQPLKALVAELGISDAFRFVSAVPAADVFRYLRIADVLVTARIRGTNTPLKIYQYLRASRPVVATAIAAHTQVLDAETAELVEPDVASLAAGILRILGDPHRARALASAAARVAVERYSEDVYMRQLAGLLQRIPARGPQPVQA